MLGAGTMGSLSITAVNGEEPEIGLQVTLYKAKKA